MVQSGPGGSLLSPLVFLELVVKTGVHHFWDFSNIDPHDGLTVNSGPVFVFVPVSMGVTEGEHRHKFAPVWFGAIFLFMWGDTLAILKDNRRVVRYLCGHFERKVPELPW